MVADPIPPVQAPVLESALGRPLAGQKTTCQDPALGCRSGGKVDTPPSKGGDPTGCAGSNPASGTRIPRLRRWPDLRSESVPHVRAPRPSAAASVRSRSWGLSGLGPPSDRPSSPLARPWSSRCPRSPPRSASRATPIPLRRRVLRGQRPDRGPAPRGRARHFPVDRIPRFRLASLARANCLRGAVAQMGERLSGRQEVTGSIPVSSTRDRSEARNHLSMRRFRALRHPRPEVAR